jgi:hypothetical protein
MKYTSKLFRHTFVFIQQCSGDNGGPAHLRIANERIRRILTPIGKAYREFIAERKDEWFQELVMGNPDAVVASNPPVCYRQNEIQLCKGVCHKFVPWVALPYILLLECKHEPLDKSLKEYPWSFSDHLVFTEPSNGEVFTFTFTAFTSCNQATGGHRTHFLFGGVVYLYNSLEKNGQAIPQKYRTLSEVAEKETRGWVPELLVYRLEGGVERIPEFKTGVEIRLSRKFSRDVNMDDSEAQKFSSLTKSTTLHIDGKPLEFNANGYQLYSTDETLAAKYREWEESSSSSVSSKPLLPQRRRPGSSQQYTQLSVESESVPSHHHSSSVRAGSPFQVDCWCGVSGDGLGLPNLPVIQCVDCLKYTHAGCITGGAARFIESDIDFQCLSCRGSGFASHNRIPRQTSLECVTSF